MKHVPINKIDKPRHKEWFNRSSELAMMEREEAWNMWRRNRRQNH
ncbi:hypothetical protein E2C01_008953 [Portunus trituberculatus]|uniref:Uncharacterized protein n=1 Tax=Portunus trituberculatus TaxID=210409 RepID=A0A5B7D5N0_PORTR|nr:hypothetical protein [Portunus trituberculatus]